MQLTRFASGMPAAAAITVLLFLGMTTLISVEPREEEPIPDIEIDIFPTVEPIPDPDPETDLPDTQVEPPPPIVRLDIPRTAVDAAPSAVEIGGLPDLGGVELTSTSFTPPDDRDETPIVRIPPEYPVTMINRNIEGSCVVTYDIAANGHPFNVSADCTNSGFVRSAERAVEGWRFNPRRENGQDVIRRGRRTSLDFELGS